MLGKVEILKEICLEKWKFWVVMILYKNDKIL